MTHGNAVAAGGPAVTLPRAGPAALHAALVAGRADLLTLFSGFERALGAAGLRIAFDPVLNLPLWELGHIGWFEEFWLARNPERARGPRANPQAVRPAPWLPGADAWYDSSAVPHASRWQLPLPTVAVTLNYMAHVRTRTLALLRASPDDDDSLYFFHLALRHEAMHAEAWLMMAQRLGIDLGTGLGTGLGIHLGIDSSVARKHRAPPQQPAAEGEWCIAAGLRLIGSDVGSDVASDVASNKGSGIDHDSAGFAFDNEAPAHRVPLAAYRIDRAPVTWRRYLPFIEAHGTAAWPPHLRRRAGGWQQCRFGVWSALDPAAPAVHVNAAQARAWCQWAGRRLPTEAEWETAARLAPAQGQAFDWGQVWEWTASDFAPYAGFTPHPYRDYSQPWFDGRPVLRGASWATAAPLRRPAYRNFFCADRSDVFAGFRSCALS